MTTLVQLWQEKTALPTWATLPFQGFCIDSRKVQQGQIFIALQGVNNDLVQTQAYIDQACAQGALGVLTEVQGLIDAAVYYDADLRHHLGKLQRDFLQAQHAQMLARVVAVTGTNGKTTVSRLIAELLTLLGQSTAVMGTTGNGILPNLESSTHTTLDALQFQEKHYTLSKQGAQFLALEASSHGLEQGRLAGTAIEVAAFTNLSRDHLDYHLTLENYTEAKAKLFDFSSLKHAVINADDEYADVMIAHAQQNPSQPKICCYSSQCQDADYFISDLSFSLQGACFQLHTATGVYTVQSGLLGRFNVDNVLAAIIAVEKLGFDLAQIIPFVPQLIGAPGRMQTIYDQDRLFIVDYAHTPDALEQVLKSLKHHAEAKLWAVFGCGGDRDRGKRPLMTQAALDYADYVLLTADNPRSEDPEQILQDMRQGITATPLQLHENLDRRLAIQHVVAQAKAGDIVVIAGKGHENYQEIQGVRHWFDDVVEVNAAIAQQGQSYPSAYPAN